MNNIIYKNEVKRAYIVLGYRAESQNTIDINGLYEDNMVKSKKFFLIYFRKRCIVEV